MKSNIVFSHNSDDWCTPSKLYQYFMDHGFIDPCPYKCDTDNLGKDFQDKYIFINPPYSNISKWVDYAIDLSYKNRVVILLIPARTDTRYFRKLLELKSSFYFITGRLHFNDSKPAPFPSVLIRVNNGRNELLFGTEKEYYDVA